MARTFAAFKGSAWSQDDWRELPHSCQWLYQLLISQPQINNLGVLHLAPRRWARLSADTTETSVTALLDELQNERYIYADWDFEELLVRTFIRHDGVEKVGNLVKSARKQFEQLQSETIRLILAHEYPEIFTSGEPLLKPLPEEVWKPLSKPLRLNRLLVEEVGEGFNRDLNPPPTGTENTRARAAKYTEAEIQASFELSRQRVAESRTETERDGFQTIGTTNRDQLAQLEEHA